ncbi:MAG: regulatory protein RecX [Solirubrobacteraceae bacterium]
MTAETDQAQRALAFAYDYINKRERTVAEVAAELQRAGVDPPRAQAAIDELVALDYLNDVRFAKLFAQDKRTLEQWGAERIERGLVARGIDRELIAATLAEPDQETELQRALAVLARRFPQPPADRRERERALRVLLRKGYDGETALQAVRVVGRSDAGSHDPFAYTHARYYDSTQ